VSRTFHIRAATQADIPALRALMTDAIDRLQTGFLSPAEIAASHAIMGLDTQLIADGTYYIAETDDAERTLAGCGGWSRRATLFGGDHTAGRAPALLDPAQDAAPFRAMYTNPSLARQGIATLILAHSEAAARTAGFSRGTLAATLAGAPFYRRHGWGDEVPFQADAGEIAIPLIRMTKHLQ